MKNRNYHYPKPSSRRENVRNWCAMIGVWIAGAILLYLILTDHPVFKLIGL